MKDFIRAIFIRPGEAPRIGTQRNRLKELRDRVGGIQFFGPILVVGVDGEEFTDVPEEEFADLYQGGMS